MSSWGITNFENDSAMEWAEKMISGNDGSLLKNTIAHFHQTFSPDETSLIECSEFLAGAEFLAAMLGSPSGDFPEDAGEWLESQYIKIEQDVLDKTINGVKNILKDSESKEIFADSGYYKNWIEVQENLITRLSE